MPSVCTTCYLPCYCRPPTAQHLFSSPPELMPLIPVTPTCSMFHLPQSRWPSPLLCSSISSLILYKKLDICYTTPSLKSFIFKSDLDPQSLSIHRITFHVSHPSWTLYSNLWPLTPIILVTQRGTFAFSHILTSNYHPKTFHLSTFFFPTSAFPSTMYGKTGTIVKEWCHYKLCPHATVKNLAASFNNPYIWLFYVLYVQ